MIFPSTLKKGDTIAIVTPSGAIDASEVVVAIDRIESWGYNVVVMPNALGINGRYCGTEEQRLDDFHQALANNAIAAILCSRGGYGLLQIIDRIDRDLIVNNPKWIIGYSDITALHALVNSCGVASIHSPMVRHIVESNHGDAPIESLRRILSEGSIVYNVKPHILNRGAEFSGRLVGGNLAILLSLRGTSFDPLEYTPNPVLFIEDIGESPYKVERMLHTLRLGGVFDRLSALIVGEFSDYNEDPSMGASLYELIRNMVEPYSFPTIFGFPVGHTQNNYPLICGSEISYTPSDGLLTVGLAK
ncbi:MAG: S66 peptidase family protein [Bacteroidales bacterium]